MSQVIRRVGRYTVVSPQPLTDRGYGELVDALNAGAKRLVGTLEGRSSPLGDQIDGLGGVFIKRYMRGGLLGTLLGDWHWGKDGKRAADEFAMLGRVRALGVMAPEPLAYVHCRGPIYRAWLVMRRLEGIVTLAELSRARLSEDELIASVMEMTARQIELLVQNGIHHVDLHPGNVLLRETDGVVMLIDFDKGRETSLSIADLRERYLRRWRRAVIKHGLPPVLNELMSMKLRRPRVV
jgi:3-deoxy-D-manno-octulosonic acid kinase